MSVEKSEPDGIAGQCSVSLKMADIRAKDSTKLFGEVK